MSARPPAVESGLQDHHRRELDRFADALWLEQGLAKNINEFAYSKKIKTLHFV